MRLPSPRLLPLLAVVAATSISFAAFADSTADLHKAAAAWDAAMVAKNTAGIAAPMTDDFVWVQGSGNVKDKKAFVDDFADPGAKLEPWKVEEPIVRIHGDSALLGGRVTMKGTDAGKPFESKFRYLDLWVRRDGKWMVASAQITRLP